MRALLPDLTVAAEFFARMAPGERLTFQTFSDRAELKQTRIVKGVPKEFDPNAQILHGTITDRGDVLSRINGKGVGIFWAVNRTDGKGRTKANIVGVRTLCVDLDGAPVGPLYACEPIPHAIVESSPGRWHGYWLVSDCSLDHFERLQRALAKRFESDPSINDLPRVLRVPGFIHRKVEPFMVRVAHLLDAGPYTVAEVVEGLGLKTRTEDRPDSHRGGNLAFDATEHKPPRNWSADALPTDRYATLRDYAWRLLHEPGTQLAELLGLVREYNATHCKPPHPEEEVRRVVSLAVQDFEKKFPTEYKKRFGKAATPTEPLATVTAAALLAAEFPPVRWTVEDVLPEGVFLLVAAPKIGKSWLSLQMALAVGDGGTVLGKKTARGSALVLALEDNDRRLQSRLRKLTFAQAFTGDTSANDRLHFRTEWPRADRGGVAAIEQWLQTHPDARLVVVDTLERIRPERNTRANAYAEDYEALRLFKGLAEKYQITILIIHHTRKMAATDPLDMISGTLGLSGAADGALILQRDRGQQSATLHLIGRDVAEEGEFRVEFNRTTCTWTMLGRATEVARSEERQEILRFLETATEPMTPTEIAQAIDRKAGTVRRLIRGLMQEGDKLIRTGHRYSLATKGANAANGTNAANSANGANAETADA